MLFPEYRATHTAVLLCCFQNITILLPQDIQIPFSKDPPTQLYKPQPKTTTHQQKTKAATHSAHCGQFLLFRLCPWHIHLEHVTLRRRPSPSNTPLRSASTSFVAATSIWASILRHADMHPTGMPSKKSDTSRIVGRRSSVGSHSYGIDGVAQYARTSSFLRAVKERRGLGVGVGAGGWWLDIVVVVKGGFWEGWMAGWGVGTTVRSFCGRLLAIRAEPSHK